MLNTCPEVGKRERRELPRASGERGITPNDVGRPSDIMVLYIFAHDFDFNHGGRFYFRPFLELPFLNIFINCIFIFNK